MRDSKNKSPSPYSFFFSIGMSAILIPGISRILFSCGIRLMKHCCSETRERKKNYPPTLSFIGFFPSLWHLIGCPDNKGRGNAGEKEAFYSYLFFFVSRFTSSAITFVIDTSVV
jgi:hypothetical protein